MDSWLHRDYQDQFQPGLPHDENHDYHGAQPIPRRASTPVDPIYFYREPTPFLSTIQYSNAAQYQRYHQQQPLYSALEAGDFDKLRIFYEDLSLDHHGDKCPPGVLGDNGLRTTADVFGESLRDIPTAEKEVKVKLTPELRACNRCQILKIKCPGLDQGFPCTHCILAMHKCIFKESSSGNQSPKVELPQIHNPNLHPLPQTQPVLPQAPAVRKSLPQAVSPVLSPVPPSNSSLSYSYVAGDSNAAISNDDWAVFEDDDESDIDSLAMESVVNYDPINSEQLLDSSPASSFTSASGGADAAPGSTKYSTREGGETTSIRILVEKLGKQECVSKRPCDKLYQLALLSKFLQPQIIKTLPGRLQGTEAQIMVDFLSDALHYCDILLSDERKRALHLLCKIAKSAQVFPKAITLAGVECDLGCAINEGGFGIIYKGTFRGVAVCVKAVRMYQVGAKKRALRAHAGELVLGAHVFHPNVLPLYGAFVSDEPTPRICIASPWMEGGSLVEFLHGSPHVPRIPLVSDILHGIQHLHGMAIVHADLKASNVLVSKTKRAVLSDFGISRVAMTNVGTTTSAEAAGTTNWMAPELLTAEEIPPATRKSDIWAFGCVCYEILTGKIPFAGYKNIQLIRAFDSGKAVLSRPEPTPNVLYADEIWSLAQMCLCYDPNERPTVGEALKFVVDLNAEDQRLPTSADPEIFDVEWLRSDVQIDYDALDSIITRFQITEKVTSSLMSPS